MVRKLIVFYTLHSNTVWKFHIRMQGYLKNFNLAIGQLEDNFTFDKCICWPNLYGINFICYLYVLVFLVCSLCVTCVFLVCSLCVYWHIDNYNGCKLRAGYIACVHEMLAHYIACVHEMLAVLALTTSHAYTRCLLFWRSLHRMHARDACCSSAHYIACVREMLAVRRSLYILSDTNCGSYQSHT